MTQTIEPEGGSWKPKLRFTIRWAPVYLVVGLGAAQFLPDYWTIRIKFADLVSVVVVTMTSLLLLRQHRQTQRHSIVWGLIRWYAVGTFALVAFIIGIRIQFPLPSSPDECVIQRVAIQLVVVPVIGLLAVALLMVSCSRDARKSPIVWYSVCLTLTVAQRSLYILIY